MKTLKEKRGFTLIEIIVILAVIAILAAVITPMATKYIGESRVSKADADCRAIEAAVTAFYKDTARWPGQVEGYEVLVGGDKEYASTNEKNMGKIDEKAQLARYLDDMTDKDKKNYPNWNGPYLTDIKLDSWNKRYLFRVKPMYDTSDKYSAWIISAGPDSKLDTKKADGAIQGDDIGTRIK